MKLDFLLCGSANDAFFSQIAFFRLCLDKLGGMYHDARVAAVFGGCEVVKIPNRWQKFFNRIEVFGNPTSDEKDFLFLDRHYQRFETIRTDADLVFLCDADVAPISRFDKLISNLHLKPALAGTIAYQRPPYCGGQRLCSEEGWQEISKAIIGKNISRK